MSFGVGAVVLVLVIVAIIFASIAGMALTQKEWSVAGIAGGIAVLTLLAILAINHLTPTI